MRRASQSYLLAALFVAQRAAAESATPTDPAESPSSRRRRTDICCAQQARFESRRRGDAAQVEAPRAGIPRTQQRRRDLMQAAEQAARSD
jgi:hypothetical protein